MKSTEALEQVEPEPEKPKKKWTTAEEGENVNDLPLGPEQVLGEPHQTRTTYPPQRRYHSRSPGREIPVLEFRRREGPQGDEEAQPLRGAGVIPERPGSPHILGDSMEAEVNPQEKWGWDEEWLHRPGSPRTAVGDRRSHTVAGASSSGVEDLASPGPPGTDTRPTSDSTATTTAEVVEETPMKAGNKGAPSPYSESKDILKKVDKIVKEHKDLYDEIVAKDAKKMVKTFGRGVTVPAAARNLQWTRGRGSKSWSRGAFSTRPTARLGGSTEALSSRTGTAPAAATGESRPREHQVADDSNVTGGKSVRQKDKTKTEHEPPVTGARPKREIRPRERYSPENPFGVRKDKSKTTKPDAKKK